MYCDIINEMKQRKKLKKDFTIETPSHIIVCLYFDTTDNWEIIVINK